MTEMIRVHNNADDDSDADYPAHIVWEALRRGILEHRKIVVTAKLNAFADLDALIKEMAPPPDQAALEGGDVPDDEAMT